MMDESARRAAEGLVAAVRSATGLEPSSDVDPFGRDAALQERIRPFLEWLYDRWFEVEATGLEALPSSEPLVLVANRAGTLPWDAAMLGVAASRRGIRLRPVLESETLDLPYVGPLASRLGAVRAGRQNAAQVLGAGEAIAVFPEGAAGARKRYRDRYRLRSFGKGGFLEVARSQGARVVPVAIVGSEEAMPVLRRLGLRSLGMPSLPITPIFPWLGPLGLLPLPVKWRILAGDPVDLPSEASSEEAAEGIRREIQEMIDRIRAGPRDLRQR